MIGKPNHLGQIERANRKILPVIQLKIKKRSPFATFAFFARPALHHQTGRGFG